MVEEVVNLVTIGIVRPPPSGGDAVGSVERPGKPRGAKGAGSGFARRKGPVMSEAVLNPK
jgi:hypothetical protein